MSSRQSEKGLSSEARLGINNSTMEIGVFEFAWVALLLYPAHDESKLLIGMAEPDVQVLGVTQ
jgi:hypothetical protein